VSDVLVTGGAGFIGSHLCETLLKRGFRVTCIDNFSTGNRDNIAHLSGLNVIVGDVNKETVWRQVKNRTFAAVFHYAATVGVRRTEENPLAVLTDTAGLYHLAKFVRAGNAERVIFASSSEVYGEPSHLPEREAEGNCGWTPYTTVKLFGEHLLTALWRETKVPTVSLRFFNVYGPRQRGNSYGFVTAKFIHQVLSGEAPTIYGDGQQTRDFVYVKDNVAAALAALTSREAAGQVINIGTGRETTVEQLALTVIAAAETDLKPRYLKSRARDILHRCADTTRMERLLNTSCQTKLVAGLRATIAWYRSQNEEVQPLASPAIPEPAR
jgi:nucleoside-diphosphate-sugar epimerase